MAANQRIKCSDTLICGAWPQTPGRKKTGWWTDRKGTKMYELVRKLNKIKRTLQELNKDRFSEVERKADEAM